MNSLKVVFWNANGLAQHTLEVQTFLLSKEIDILLVSETHFTKKSHFSIPQYNFYHVMHPDGKAHGGSGILIRKNIKHHQGTHYCTEEIQATNIIVEDWQGSLTVSSVYSPPKHSIKKDQYLRFFQTLSRRFIACGDYNAKHTSWGSRLISPKGRQLYWAINELNLNTFSPDSPTYWPSDLNKTPDLIDFCVSKGIPPLNIKCVSCYDLSSDHSPSLLYVNTRHITTDQPCKLHSKKTNWHYFRYLVRTNLNTDIPLKSDDDISECVEHLIKVIQNASWNSTPQQSFNCTIKSSAEIRKKIAEKRKSRKRWQTTKSPADKAILNKLTKDLQNLLQSENDKNLEREIKKLGPTMATDYSLWKITKKIKHPRTRVNHPVRKTDHSWTKSNQEKADTFASYLKTVFTPNSCEDTPEYIQQFLKQTHQLDLPIKKFTKAEVSKVIQNLKLNKAPGYDLITAKTLKELPKEGRDFVTYIFNACLTRCFVPPQWKVAQITMVQKPGKPENDVKSYRPISLLPILSKVLESLFLKRLMPIIDSKCLIPDHQFGFRKDHGTIEQVHRLVEIINDAFETKQYCTAAFLDISQAFDKVWHDGLLFKLKKQLPLNFYLFIRSYLQNRFFYVQEVGEMSDISSVMAGVPQGSIMGPILYLLFTTDLPQVEGTTIGTFADDTAALVVNKDKTIASEKLQIYINSLSNWLKNWRIKANESKSVQVTFTLNQGTCPPITLNQVEIPQENEARYLGIHLDRKLKWKKHIQTKRKALDIQFNKTKFLIGSRSHLSIENKLLIYKCIIKPIWTYGIQLWGTASNTNIKTLQQFQSKTLRKIANAPWYITNNRLHQELNIPTLKEEIQSQLISYKSRIERHPNALASHLMTNTGTFSRLRRRAPQDLLF